MFSIAATMVADVVQARGMECQMTLRNLALSGLAAIRNTGDSTSDIVVRRLGGGRNSQVFAIPGVNGAEIVLKHYFQAADDPRDRLNIEFSTLSFLWGEGERAIPEPLAVFPELNCALYELVSGNPLSLEGVSLGDVAAAAAFLERLDNLARQGKGRELPVASEACFSTRQLVRIVATRRARLDALSGPWAAAAAEFLRNRFDPVLAAVVARLADSPEYAQLLPQAQRTLSPSDFGFHNALRRTDSTLAFLDFEYFGWDDPVKLVSDLWLHPGMSLPESLAKRFIETVTRKTPHPEVFFDRLATHMPLYALKWVMILLNEFTQRGAGRRAFAGALGNPKDRRGKQLTKAATMLERARELLHSPVFPTECS